MSTRPVRPVSRRAVSTEAPAAHPVAPTIEACGPFDTDRRAPRDAALHALLPRLRADHGPVLVAGTGSATVLTNLLTGAPQARLLALEPDHAVRALVLACVTGAVDRLDRVTVRPEDFFSATLPDRLAGAVLLGVLGRVDVGERGAVLAELAARLPVGGVALVDLPGPTRPTRVEPWESTSAVVGSLRYRTITEAWPLGTERMRWRTTYLTLDGERVLHEHTAVHEYHHPAPTLLAAEAELAGLRLDRLDEPSYWTLTRV